VGGSLKLELPPIHVFDAGRVLSEEEAEKLHELYLNPEPKPVMCRLQSDNCHYAHGPVRRR
jgi:hypothetical protein